MEPPFLAARLAAGLERLDLALREDVDDEAPALGRGAVQERALERLREVLHRRGEAPAPHDPGEAAVDDREFGRPGAGDVDAVAAAVRQGARPLSGLAGADDLAGAGVDRYHDPARRVGDVERAQPRARELERARGRGPGVESAETRRPDVPAQEQHRRGPPADGEGGRNDEFARALGRGGIGELRVPGGEQSQRARATGAGFFEALDPEHECLVGARRRGAASEGEAREGPIGADRIAREFGFDLRALARSRREPRQAQDQRRIAGGVRLEEDLDPRGAWGRRGVLGAAPRAAAEGGGGEGGPARRSVRADTGAPRPPARGGSSSAAGRTMRAPRRSSSPVRPATRRAVVSGTCARSRKGRTA